MAYFLVLLEPLLPEPAPELPELPEEPELPLAPVLPPPLFEPTELGLAAPPLMELPALPMPLDPLRLLEPLCPVLP